MRIYLKKEIYNENKKTSVEFWQANGNIKAKMGNGAVIEVNGFKDAQAIIDGGEHLIPDSYKINDISSLEAYPALFSEILQKLISDPESKWYGAEVVIIEE